MFHQLNTAVWSWVESFRISGKGRLWLPFVIFFAFQLVILFMLVSFAHPLLAWILAPAVRALFGETATHYPMSLVVLPPVFAVTNLVVGAFVWVLSLVMAVSLFTAAFQKTQLSTGQAFRQGRRAYLDVLLTQAPFVVLVAILVFVVPRLLPAGAGDSPSGMMVRLQRYGTVAAGIVLEALFVAAPLYVVLDGLRAPAALARGFRFFARNVPGLLLLVALPAVLHLPLGFVDRRWREILEKGSPELLIAVVFVDALLYVLTNFVLVGGVTRYYLARRV